MFYSPRFSYRKWISFSIAKSVAKLADFEKDNGFFNLKKILIKIIQAILRIALVTF